MEFWATWGLVISGLIIVAAVVAWWVNRWM